MPFSVPHDDHRYFLARLGFDECGNQIFKCFDILAVKFHDQVAAPETGQGGGFADGDIFYQNTGDLLLERRGRAFADALHLHADETRFGARIRCRCDYRAPQDQK